MAHKYTVKNVKRITKDTILLTLNPKNSRDTLRFYPGQYAAIGFKKGLRPSPVRCFSIVSSPNQSEELQFGIKILGDFSNTISELSSGSKVFVHGPFGDFGLDEDYDKSAIMLAGGIGITPFISNIRYLTEIKSNIRLTLLYSNKDQDNIPFLEELIQIEKLNPRLNVVYFVTRGPIDKLKGLKVIRSRIDARKLKQLTDDRFNNFTYFICGPKQFTTSLSSELINLGTDSGLIMSEEFTPTGADNLPNSTNKKLTRWTYSLTAATLAMAIFGIMVLDLARHIPKVSATSHVNTSSQTSTPTGSDTTSSSGSSTNAQDSGSSTSSVGSSTSTNQNTSSPSVQKYQAPTTSVS